MKKLERRAKIWRNRDRTSWKRDRRRERLRPKGNKPFKLWNHFLILSPLK